MRTSIAPAGRVAAVLGPRAETFAALNTAANALWSGWLLAIAGGLWWRRAVPFRSAPPRLVKNNQPAAASG